MCNSLSLLLLRCSLLHCHAFLVAAMPRLNQSALCCALYSKTEAKIKLDALQRYAHTQTALDGAGAGFAQ